MKKSKEEPLNLPTKRNDYNGPKQKSYFLEWAFFFIAIVLLVYITSIADKPYEEKVCKKFHKKTQAELDIDDCNNNPREDEKCKCEEQKDTEKITSGYACPDSCENITVRDCYIKGIYSYGRELEIEGIYLYDYCELKSGFDDRITSFQNISMFITERNITNCEQCYNYEKVCLKSRPKPKTECEEGNPDWAEETKIEEVDTSIIPHPSCKLQTGWFCPGVGIVNLPCENDTGQCHLYWDFSLNDFGLSYIRCEYKEQICISNQTICREKTKKV